MDCTIDVWLIDLTGAAATAPDMTLLSPAEWTRLRSFISPAAAHEFASTRMALRQILGQRLGMAPARIALSAQGGKPFIDGTPRCCFNVTHAGGLAAIAIHDAIQVGIDLEHRSSFECADVLSDTLCSPLERAWWQANAGSMPPVDVLARLWTGKEAALKAIGQGFAIPPHEVDLSPTIAEGSGRVVLPASFALEPGLALLWQALALPAGWHGAVTALVPPDCARLVARYRTFAPVT